MYMPSQQFNNNQTAPEAGNLALLSNMIESEAGQEGHQKALKIASVLQTTLEIDKLIEVFSNEIQGLIPHNSISFSHKSQNIHVAKGTEKKHACSYQLVVAAQTIGQLTFTRTKKFSDNETALLESLICSLVYPLRNAVMYKHALTAAHTDPLTGANNRSTMNSALIRETELARRYNTPLSLLALDIDKFKSINDSYGHLAGDFIIKSVADAIVECIRSSDILFRSGGEEFIILLSNTAKQGALMLAERIRHTIATADYDYNEHQIALSTSLGVSCFKEGDNSETLFEKADIALYAAKADGRNCVRYNDTL